MSTVNLVSAFIILWLYANVEGDSKVETVVDSQLDEIISQNDYVLALFQQDPCVGEDCEGALRETSHVASSSYIPGLKVLHLVNSAWHAKYSLGNKSRLIYFRKTVPILFDSGLIQMDDVVVWLEQNKEPNSRYLDASNFEHLTQAATGATTGDWFILFHKDQCNQLLPIWESVASHLRHRINIAIIDIASNPELKARFQITRCPTIIYFRLGRMYMYELPTQEITPFLQFADGWYVNAPSFAVPKDPTPFDVLTDNVVSWLKEHLGGVGVTIVVGLAAVAVLVVLKVACKRFLKKKKPKLY